MGRMLQALNQSEARRSAPRVTVECRPVVEPVPEPEPVCAETVEPEPAEVEECEEESSASFIEVGGPRHLVEASPDVIPLPTAHTEAPAATKQPEPAAVEDDDDETVGTVSIYCSWTLRRGLKQAG